MLRLRQRGVGAVNTTTNTADGYKDTR